LEVLDITSSISMGEGDIIAPGALAFDVGVLPKMVQLTLSATGSTEWNGNPKFDLLLYSDSQWQKAKTAQGGIGVVGSLAQGTNRVSFNMNLQATAQGPGKYWIVADNSASYSTDPPDFSSLKFTWQVSIANAGTGGDPSKGTPVCPNDAPFNGATPQNILPAGQIPCQGTCFFTCNGHMCTLTQDDQRSYVNCKTGSTPAPSGNMCTNQDCANYNPTPNCPPTIGYRCDCVNGFITRKYCADGSPPPGPTPAQVNPTPAQVNPTPAQVNPTPAGVNPTPAGVNPTPAQVNPTPVGFNPTPVGFNPTPAGISPTPAGQAVVCPESSCRVFEQGKCQPTQTEKCACITGSDGLVQVLAKTCVDAGVAPTPYMQPGQTSFAPGPTGADGCVAGACEASAMANCGLAPSVCVCGSGGTVVLSKSCGNADPALMKHQGRGACTTVAFQQCQNMSPCPKTFICHCDGSGNRAGNECPTGVDSAASSLHQYLTLLLFVSVFCMF